MLKHREEDYVEGKPDLKESRMRVNERKHKASEYLLKLWKGWALISFLLGYSHLFPYPRSYFKSYLPLLRVAEYIPSKYHSLKKVYREHEYKPHRGVCWIYGSTEHHERWQSSIKLCFFNDTTETTLILISEKLYGSEKHSDISIYKNHIAGAPAWHSG